MMCMICGREHGCDNPGHTLVECEQIITDLKARLSYIDKTLRDWYKDESAPVEHMVRSVIGVADAAIRERDELQDKLEDISEKANAAWEQRDAARSKCERLVGLLKAAGVRIVYDAELELHKTSCDCLNCTMVRRIDAEIGENNEGA